MVLYTFWKSVPYKSMFYISQSYGIQAYFRLESDRKNSMILVKKNQKNNNWKKYIAVYNNKSSCCIQIQDLQVWSLKLYPLRYWDKQQVFVT